MHFIYYPLSSCYDRNSDSLPVCYLLHISIFISNYEFHLSVEFLKQHCNYSPKVSQKLLSISSKNKLYQTYLFLLQEGNINYSLSYAILLFVKIKASIAQFIKFLVWRELQLSAQISATVLRDFLLLKKDVLHSIYGLFFNVLRTTCHDFNVSLLEDK